MINDALKTLERKKDLFQSNSAEEVTIESFYNSLLSFFKFFSKKSSGKSPEEFLKQISQEWNNGANKFTDLNKGKIERLGQIIMGGYKGLLWLYKNPSWLIHLIELMTWDLFQRVGKDPDSKLFLILLTVGLVEEEELSLPELYSDKLKAKGEYIASLINCNKPEREESLRLPELIKKIFSSDLLTYSPSVFGYSSN
ncbi:MAG: hypothetical protein ACPLKP_00765 [Microgenomates group bacterium]